MSGKVLVAGIVTVALSGCANLSAETRVEEAAYQVTAAVDGMTTLNLASHPDDNHHETNPLLGPHPSPGKVTAYFVAGGLAHYGVTSALEAYAPRWAVRTWEGASIALEVGCVAGNVGSGIEPRLEFHVNR